MKRLALLAAASASLSLFGCDSASTTSPDAGGQASVNNSDNRKASYTPATAEDSLHRQSKWQSALKFVSETYSEESRGAAARLVTGYREIAFLNDPSHGSSNRLFMHTETNANADQVREGSAWQVINNNAARLISDRTHIYWWAHSYWVGGTSRLDKNAVWYWYPDQSTGVNGMQYTSVTVPWYRLSGYGMSEPYPYDNNPIPGMNLYFTKVSVASLPRLPFDYIVLRLDDQCPDGGYPFTQHFDEEDVNNHSGATFDLSPGWSGPGATGANLAFCFVPSSGVAMAASQLDEVLRTNFGNAGSAAIFAAPDPLTILPGLRAISPEYTVNTLMPDAEDTDWAGGMIWETLPAEYRDRVNAIMYPAKGSETPYISIFNLRGRITTVG